MTNEKIYIGIDDERIELIGAEKTEFLADRAATNDFIVQEKQKRVESKAAAQAKLAALGLTVSDLEALGL